MSTYRFSWHRPGGWTRLGAAGAVGILFVTPVLWSLGVFGAAEDTLKRAMIFAFAGMWFCVGFGYMLGWALMGFMVKLKDHDEDEDAHKHAPPSRPPAASGAHRSSGH